MGLEAEVTCELLKGQEKCAIDDCLCRVIDSPSAAQAIIEESFWGAPDSIPADDRDWRRKQLAMYALATPLCHEMLSNGKATTCCTECGATEGQCCPPERETYCDDPDECPTRNYGVDALALTRAALHAIAQEPIKVAQTHAEVKALSQANACEPVALLFNPSARPTRQSNDPCTPSVGGAFEAVTMKELAEALRPCIRQIIQEELS